MLIRDFQIGSNGVQVTFRNSRKRHIHLDKDSGKRFFRDGPEASDGKVYPGVYIGADDRGSSYYIQCHPEEGYASMVTEKDFAQGQEVQEGEKEDQDAPMEVLTRALEKAMEGVPYELLKPEQRAFKGTGQEGASCPFRPTPKALALTGSILLIAGGIAVYLLNGSGKR